MTDSTRETVKDYVRDHEERIERLEATVTTSPKLLEAIETLALRLNIHESTHSPTAEADELPVPVRTWDADQALLAEAVALLRALKHNDDSGDYNGNAFDDASTFLAQYDA